MEAAYYSRLFSFYTFEGMKILVVRFSSIGDVVLTTPVVRCLKQQTQAEVHYITKAAFAPVLEGNPYIDELIVIQKSVDEVLDRLKAENYDYVIDLHHNIRTFRLKRALNVKSFAFPKKNIAKFFLTKFKLNHMPELHVVDRYFQAVKSLGVKNDGKPADFFLLEKDTVDLKKYGLSSSSYVAVAMGAQFATKQIPLALLTKILEPIEIPIVLLGGTMDAENARILSEKLMGKKIHSFCGEFTLKQSAYLTKEAGVLLTGDTGLMHIASCFETPIVSVWGNTVPDFGMYAYTPKNKSLASIHEVLNLSCRPCSKIGYQSCPKKHFNCMNLQNPSNISKDILTQAQSVDA